MIRPRLIRSISALWLALAAMLVPSARAHDVANEVVVNAFLRAKGERLDLAIRLPLTLLLTLEPPRRGASVLDLAQIDEAMTKAAATILRDIQIIVDGDPRPATLVKGRIALPADRAFESIEAALRAIHGPPPPENEAAFWNQGFFDVHVTYAPRPALGDIALRLSLAPDLGNRLHFVLRYVAPDGAIRPFDFKGGSGEFQVDPRWHQSAWLFFKEGVAHILGGIDHLLFLLCLVIPFRRRLRGLVGVVTAFTLGHSVTLIAAAQGLAPSGAWFAPGIEALIALSIVYMAIENAVGADFRRRWWIAAGFGLVHGFGFAGALGETMQFAGAHLVLALVSFNLGIEAGQIAALLVAIPILNLAFRHVVMARYGVILTSILVGHEAWHWMIDRAKAIPMIEPRQFALATAYDLALWGLTALFLVLLAWSLLRAALRRGPRLDRRP